MNTAPFESATRMVGLETAADVTTTATEPPAIPAVDRERYSLLSLMELCRTIWTAHDVYDAAEGLLLSLMGQIGSTQAALWMNDDDDGRLVLIRCHGMDRLLAQALAAASWAELRERARSVGRSAIAADEVPNVTPATMVLARQARIALFAPVCADGVPIGLVALGLPQHRSEFTAFEIEVIEASLGVAGMAFHAARLQGRSAETGRTLRRALEDVRDVDRMKSEFIDRVNQELRTPLSVVLGCLESMSSGDGGREKQYALVDTAVRSARALEGLIERILLFSASSHGELTVRLEEADLAVFLREFAAERRPGISAGLRRLELDGTAVARRARFDRQRLRQVLDELVDNAVRYSLPGTTLRIGLSDCFADDLAWRRISVDDEGFGIPADRLGSLFQPFARPDDLRGGRTGGLGIGLAAARRVIEAMHGRITVASEEGQGSRFAVMLPTA